MINQLIAFKILSMLVTPFKETTAFKLGIVDENGKLLKKVEDLRTLEEKEAYDILTRLVFNLKRILIKLPGGDARLKNIAAAYFLVKENINSNPPLYVLEEQLNNIINTNTLLIEETLTVIDFLNNISEDAPVNATGPAVSTNEPVIKKTKKLIRRVSVTC